MKQILGHIRRADERYAMIKPGDKICVGVSGGKDSLLLMHGLELYRRFSKNPFELCAVMLDLGLIDQDTEPVKRFAKDAGIQLDIIPTNIGKIVFEERKEKKPCAMCAKLRRGALNNAALQRGCNLVALGHNREDVIETLFLSLLYESRINTFGPVTYMDRAGVTIIRPLVFMPEKYAQALSKRLSLPVMRANCPAAGKTAREDMKDVIRFFLKYVPNPEERFINAVANTEKYGLWDRLRLPPD